MITDDEIMRLFELADPARHDDGARMVDAAGYLDALQTRSYDMTLTEITTEAPTKRPRDNRWVLAAIVAAAIVLIVAGALLLSRDNGQEPVPVAPPTTLTSVAPTNAVEQGAGQSVDEAVAVVRSFYDARNAFDADTALSFLTDDAIVWPWSQGTAEPHGIAGPDDFRLQTESAASTNAKLMLGDCTAVEHQGPGIKIRCGYEYQDLRSDELGIGPFGNKTTDVLVVDGKITSIVESGHSDDEFQQLLWDPFGAWLSARHPEDAAVKDAGDTPNEESIRMWDQRSQEWVQARLAAEQAATQFLNAYGAFDAEAAGSYLANGASTEGIVHEDVQDYTQAIALYQAWGYEQELGSCQQIDATPTGSQVRCPFAYHLLGSRELGVGPFQGSYFTVTVDDATGLITDVTTTWVGSVFMREVGDPFTEWVRTTYPDAEATISVNGGPALTPESLALWEQYRHEYVQYVLSGTPTTTTA